ncbi:MAG: HemK2/MTQ2 family protein methyltransferase [Nanoarchaeota archaeon]
MIYEPAEDSFLLKYEISDYVKEGMKVLDVGTGSGILALEAKECGAEVYAVDINQEAVKFCKNLGIKTKQSDLFDNVPESDKFHIIIFNPPYLPKEELEDEESAVITSGGEKGNEIIERFLIGAKNFLVEDGKILFLSSSMTPDVEKILVREGYKFKIVAKQKLFFEELYVYLAWS